VWWLRKAPSAGPLLTIGSENDAIPGALGQPGTLPLFGDRFSDHNYSGLRFNVGVALNSDLALEGNYFALERRTVGISLASDANGSPLIARPVINDLAGLQESYSTSFPGLFAGQSTILARTQLQGFEINAAYGLSRGEGNSLTVIAGFRYVDLWEGLLFADSLTPLTTDVLTFQGASVNPPSTVGDFDGFRTRNHFYGGQIGARWQSTFGPVEVGVVGNIALGATDQRVDIAGSSALFTPGAAPTVVPGGILAQPTNMGSHSRNVFSVVPELGVNVGWKVTPWLTANVGYTFLYWSDVVRPGAQIDSRINPVNVPTDQNFGQGAAGGHPLFDFHTSDFWAQGFNFGVELRF
jgi:hypothetical protein